MPGRRPTGSGAAACWPPSPPPWRRHCWRCSSSPRPGSASVALAFVGAAFGATAAVYLATISSYYSVSEMARIHGRITLAYGIGGIVAPIMAGALYDWEGGFHLSLLIGAGFAAAGGIAAGLTLPRPARSVAIPDDPESLRP